MSYRLIIRGRPLTIIRLIRGLNGHISPSLTTQLQDSKKIWRPCSPRIVLKSTKLLRRISTKHWKISSIRKKKYPSSTDNVDSQKGARIALLGVPVVSVSRCGGTNSVGELHGVGAPGRSGAGAPIVLQFYFLTCVVSMIVCEHIWGFTLRQITRVFLCYKVYF